jgi:hypothetical protein
MFHDSAVKCEKYEKLGNRYLIRGAMIKKSRCLRTTSRGNNVIRIRVQTPNTLEKMSNTTL